MLGKLKAEVIDWLKLSAIVLGILIFLGLILSPVLFELLKAFAVIKYLFS